MRLVQFMQVLFRVQLVRCSSLCAAGAYEIGTTRWRNLAMRGGLRLGAFSDNAHCIRSAASRGASRHQRPFPQSCKNRLSDESV